jgi:hypothetical protein
MCTGALCRPAWDYFVPGGDDGGSNNGDSTSKQTARLAAKSTPQIIRALNRTNSNK